MQASFGSRTRTSGTRRRPSASLVADFSMKSQVRQHPRAFEHRAELDLPPPTPLVGRLERADERLRLAGQQLLRFGDRTELPAQLRVLAIGLAKVRSERVQRVLDRIERRAGELKERIVVPPERVRRQRRERILEAVARLLDERQLFGCRPALGVQRRLKHRGAAFRPQRPDGRRRAERREQADEDDGHDGRSLGERCVRLNT